MSENEISMSRVDSVPEECDGVQEGKDDEGGRRTNTWVGESRVFLYVGFLFFASVQWCNIVLYYIILYNFVKINTGFVLIYYFVLFSNKQLDKYIDIINVRFNHSDTFNHWDIYFI